MSTAVSTTVMPGLVPGNHVFLSGGSASKTWMAEI